MMAKMKGLKNNYKKLILIASILLVVVTVISFNTSTIHKQVFDNEIKIQIDGEYVNVNPSPIIVDDRILVPIRAISEILGANVSFNDVKQQINIILDDTTINLFVGNHMAIVNEHEILLDVYTQIIDGSTFMPLRVIADGVGINIGFVDGVVYIEKLSSSLSYSEDMYSSVIDSLKYPISILIKRYFESTESINRSQTSMAIFLQDIDGIGMEGIFALRLEQFENEYHVFGRIFYYYNNKWKYKDVGKQDKISRIAIVVEDVVLEDEYWEWSSEIRVMPTRGIRPVNIVQNSYIWAATVFTTYNGILSHYITIVRDLLNEGIFYYIHGGIIERNNTESVEFKNWEQRYTISYEEFHTIMNRFKLHRLGNPWYQMADETERILSQFH